MKILYVCHRIPYPPNKGEKIRAYHLIRHLADRHEVHLFCLDDRKDDLDDAGALSAVCSSVTVCPLNPLIARLKSIAALFKGQPLTLEYFRSSHLMRKVTEAAARTRFDVGVAYSSGMIPYLSNLGLPWVVDFVDLDSQKWHQYAASTPPPLGWLYRREAEKLFLFEKQASERADASIFVTPEEGRLLEERGAPKRMHSISLGVDTDYYRLDIPPDRKIASQERPVILFVGNMDYRPNYEAVCFFARTIFPQVTAQMPRALFLVVGAHPHRSVRALHDGESIIVTGQVVDPRPYLRAASLAVVPLYMARGIQTKVLEAMAMELPVVLSTKAAEGIGAEPGRDYLVTDDPGETAARVIELIRSPGEAKKMGQAARSFIVQTFQWPDKADAYEKVLIEAKERTTSDRSQRTAPGGVLK